MMDWGAFIKEYGLPLSMLLIFGVAVIRGYLVPGPTHADVKEQRDRALDLVYEIAHGLKAEPKGSTKTADTRRRERGG